jgi:hypothetical protein
MVDTAESQGALVAAHLMGPRQGRELRNTSETPDRFNAKSGYGNPSRPRSGCWISAALRCRFCRRPWRSLWATLKVYALTPDSHQSIGSILEHQAENVPDKDCLLFEGRALELPRLQRLGQPHRTMC